MTHLMRHIKVEMAVGLAMPRVRTPSRLGRFMSSSSVRQVAVLHLSTLVSVFVAACIASTVRQQLMGVAGAAARFRVGPRVMHRVVADQQFACRALLRISSLRAVAAALAAHPIR